MDFNILYCEDNKTERKNIKLSLKTELSSLKNVNVNIKTEDFEKSFQEIENCYDLLILDLHDNRSSKPNKNSGIDILHQNELQLKIPTVVYSSKNNDVQFFEDDNKKKYSSFIKLIPKKFNSYNNLIEFVKGIIINKIPTEEYYQLYNENDVSLRLNIERIGHKHFNFILYSIFEQSNSVITVEPMPSGWSGAVLFKLLIETDSFVLKLSKDIEALKNEHQKSIEFYGSFPDQLTISIKKDDYYSFDESVVGFLIKNIENSTTLLSYILKHEDVLGIKKVLNEIYTSDNSLSNHYKKRIDKNNKKDWSAIFEKINNGKIKWVKQNYNDLKPIITIFYKEISVNNFERICIDNKYEKLNKNELLDETFKKHLVLSHGDFHANNILVQGERPFIIDTGALGYQHWALDISRLITSIFILGLDRDTVNYYDLNRIPYYIETGKKIISKEPIIIKEDDENKNALIAINWLLENIEEIYKTQFSLFEFQLGLMKEFLQVSYRNETIPPNKRALALILADVCLNKANKNVK